MKATITSIRLKSPFKFFPLSLYALRIVRQLKPANCLAFKKRGIWTLHYTMTLWEDEGELKAFAGSGAHLDAMRKSASIAREIRTYTYDTEQLPNWAEAKRLLKDKGRAIRY